MSQYIMLLKTDAIRDAQYTTEYAWDTDPLDDTWQDIQEPMFLGVYNGTKDEAIEAGAAYALTDKQNIEVIKIEDKTNRSLVQVMDGRKQETLYMVAAEEGIDIPEAIEAAAKEASDKGETCWLSEIPEQYLEAKGLRKQETPVLALTERKLGQTAMEKAGIRYAACTDCQYCTDGFCGKFNEDIDPKNTGEDCIRSSVIYSLEYQDHDNPKSKIYLYSNKELSEKEIPKVLDLLKADGNKEVSDILASNGYDPEYWDIGQTGEY